MNKIWIIVAVVAFIFSVNACKQKQNKQNRNRSAVLQENLLQMNQKEMRAENRQIEDFIKRYGWNMKQSKSGLRYMIVEKNSNKFANTGDMITFAYILRNIKGDEVYTSDEKGLFQFRLKKDHVIAGIQQMMEYIAEGDKAKVIIPAYLGYGLTGDMDKIPPRSTLIYDIEIKNIEKH